MRIIITLLLGVLYTLCFAPYYHFEMGFIALSGLLLILDKVSKKRKGMKKVFWYGFLFAFGHHVSGLYWISNSMLVEADKFAWMIPLTVSILPAYFAIYIGLTCYITYKLRMKGIEKIFFFSGLWVLMEMARGYVFTGFPWNLAGYSFLSGNSMAQAGSVIGVYGLSLIAIMLFTTPYLTIRNYLAFKKLGRVYRSSLSLYYLMPALLGFTLLSVWGDERIMRHMNLFEKTNIRIVQPNIPQSEKFDPLRVGDHLFRYYNLTLKEPSVADYVPDLIIWPEAATPINLAQDKNFLEEVADIIPYSSYLILGSIRYEGWRYNMKAYNSVQFIDADGKLETKSYDKHHLVPFGEYVPLRKYLPGVERIAKGIGDFSTGNGPKTLQLPNSESFSPLICYEVIFPGEVVDKFNPDRPKWLLNVTNDGWFGNSSGPYQHLDIARMRAIEEGLPLIRAANTGISAVIDANGRILKSISLNEEGIIDTKLPAAIPSRTLFSLYGNQIPITLAGASIVFSLLLKILFLAFRKKKSRQLKLPL